MTNIDDTILFNQRPRSARALREKLTDGVDVGERVTLAFDGRSATYKFVDGSFADACVERGVAGVRWSDRRYPKE